MRTPNAAERVKRSVSRFITGRLKLVVNEEKSSAGRPWHSKYLGFRITRLIGKTRTCIHPDSVKRLRKKVRELTARDRGRSLGAVVGELNGLLRGWAEYFRPGLRETLAGTLDHWIRRRLRAYLWTLWKLPRTKVRNLEERGVAHRWAMAVGNTRKGRPYPDMLFSSRPWRTVIGVCTGGAIPRSSGFSPNVPWDVLHIWTFWFFNLPVFKNLRRGLLNPFVQFDLFPHSSFAMDERHNGKKQNRKNNHETKHPSACFGKFVVCCR